MERKIKFRLWDRGANKMVTSENNDFWSIGLDGGVYYGNAKFTKDGDYLEYPLILCQFTGLLDKNGVEIYEDDILMEVESAGHIHWNTMGGYYQLIEVGKNGCPDLEIVDGVTLKLGIIGNIYENPSLTHL